MQKKRWETKQTRGSSYPRIHALVYSVEDGILHELPLDNAELGSFAKQFKVFDLYGNEDWDGILSPSMTTPMVTSTKPPLVRRQSLSGSGLSSRRPSGIPDLPPLQEMEKPLNDSDLGAAGTPVAAPL